MTDVQITFRLPVLKVGSSPESGPTVIKHLQLMLNQRGGFPILIEDGEFGPSTGASVQHYQQNENLTVDGVVENRHGHLFLTNGSCSRSPVRTVDAQAGQPVCL
jgi:peptidoglycan hydrolase-like protein with peptidoglycan-binding domain